MTNTTIVLLNGPARSGKDTLGNALVKTLDPDQGMGSRARALTFKFANLLKRMTHGTFGLGHLMPHALEDRKDKPMDEMFGLTPRQAYIAVSEKLVKPTLGADFFGKYLAQIIRDANVRYAIITDSGFAGEAKALMLNMPEDTRYLLVKLAREGFTFEGDSRSYITLRGVRTMDANLGKDCLHLDAVVGQVLQQMREARYA